MAGIDLKSHARRSPRRPSRYDRAASGCASASESVEAQLDAKRIEVEQKEALARLRRSQNEALHVRAGMEGVLQQVSVEVGQRVPPGTNLARVAQPARLKAVVKVPETQAKDIQLGQRASIDTRNGMIAGHVTRIDPAVSKGTVAVDVALDGALPKGARPDLTVDGTIELERLANVVYVGRPAQGQGDSQVGLFRLEPDGRSRSRVKVGSAAHRSAASRSWTASRKATKSFSRIRPHGMPLIGFDCSRGEDASPRTGQAREHEVRETMGTLLQDLRYGTRMLVRAPAVTTAGVVVTLALGIGVTSAIFSVAHSVLLRRLPFPEPGRLVAVVNEQALTGGQVRASWSDLGQLQGQADVLETVALYHYSPESWATAEAPGSASARVARVGVSSGFFSALGVRPHLGDLPSAAAYEAPQGTSGEKALLPVVLSHDFWRTHFGGQPDALGRGLIIDRQRAVVRP